MVDRARNAGAPRGPRYALAAVLVFSILYGWLSMSRAEDQSATWDEPQHMAAGYAALSRADYRLDWEHPPLGRAWAALPLLWTPEVVFDAEHVSWHKGPQWRFGHRFVYRDNDADRMLGRSRFMVTLLGIGLGLLVFSWARELFGLTGGLSALVLYTLEPNQLAHAGIVSTDTACSLFYFAASYLLWRLLRRFSWGNLAGLVVFFSLAQITKYSALVLFVVVPVLLALRVLRPGSWPAAGEDSERSTRASRGRAALLVMVMLVSGSAFSIWAAYAFRYEPTPAPTEFQFEYDTDDRTQLASDPVDQLVRWADTTHLLPAAYARGFLLGRGKAKERRGYLMGETRLGSWWYYFPLTILFKTPLVLLGLGLAGLVLLCAGRLRPRENRSALLVPPAIFLAAAMFSSLNIGVRHVLPVYPFLVLLAGGAASFLFRRRRWFLALPAVLLLAEFALVHPYYLAAFNVAAGGPSAGHHLLADSNIDWGQDLEGLGRWMRENEVETINLSYFGTANPAYYGIDCTHMPGSPFFVPKPTMPDLPGYVAVSVTNLHGVYLTPRLRKFYAPLIDREPVTTIGHSIHVYWVDEPWW